MMDGFVGFALTNAATASLLGIVVAVASRWIKRPAVVHALWVVVLCDLLMPPILRIGVLPGPPRPLDSHRESSLAAVAYPGMADGLRSPVEAGSLDAPRLSGSGDERTHLSGPTRFGELQGRVARPPRVLSRGASLRPGAAHRMDSPAMRLMTMGTRDIVEAPLESEHEQASEIEHRSDQTSLSRTESPGAGFHSDANSLAQWLGSPLPLEPPLRSALRSLMPLPTSLQAVDLLGWVWLAGTLGVLLLGFLRAVRFCRRIRGSPDAAPSLRARAATMATTLGMRRSPGIRLVSARISPLLWFRRGAPVVLFPERLLAELRDEERDALLMHELAHVKRRDHWVRLLEFGASAAFWWHPLLYWARREMRRAEEQSCDAWVLRCKPGVACEYAQGLIKTVEFLAGVRPCAPALASSLGTYRLMEERLKMILRGNTPKKLSWLHGAALVAVAGAVLVAFPTRSASTPAAPAEGDFTAGRADSPEASEATAPRAPSARTPRAARTSTPAAPTAAAHPAAPTAEATPPPTPPAPPGPVASTAPLAPGLPPAPPAPGASMARPAGGTQPAPPAPGTPPAPPAPGGSTARPARGTQPAPPAPGTPPAFPAPGASMAPPAPGTPPAPPAPGTPTARRAPGALIAARPSSSGVATSPPSPAAAASPGAPIAALASASPSTRTAAHSEAAASEGRSSGWSHGQDDEARAEADAARAEAEGREEEAEQIQRELERIEAEIERARALDRERVKLEMRLMTLRHGRKRAEMQNEAVRSAVEAELQRAMREAGETDASVRGKAIEEYQRAIEEYQRALEESGDLPEKERESDRYEEESRNQLEKKRDLDQERESLKRSKEAGKLERKRRGPGQEIGPQIQRMKEALAQLVQASEQLNVQQQELRKHIEMLERELQRLR